MWIDVVGASIDSAIGLAMLVIAGRAGTIMEEMREIRMVKI